jgi:hypothetical protein
VENDSVPYRVLLQRAEEKLSPWFDGNAGSVAMEALKSAGWDRQGKAHDAEEHSAFEGDASSGHSSRAKNAEGACPSPLLSTLLPIYTANQLDDLPEPEWMVENLFQARGLVALYGAEGTGKTFTALDLALCIATGRPFHGREVETGPVVYVYGEGAPGLKPRVRAWEQEHGAGPGATSRIGFIPVPVDLTDDGGRGLQKLTSTVEEFAGDGCSLVVLDTLAMTFGTKDENDTQAMNVYTKRCARLRERFGCTVLVIHHTGWETTRERGNRSLRNNFDTVIKCSVSNGNRIRYACDKQKDGLPFEPFQLERVEVKLSEAENGDPSSSGSLTSSCVLRDVSYASEPELSDEQRKQLGVLDGFGDAGATYRRWCEAAVEEGISESSFKRNREKLVERKCVQAPPPGDSKGFPYTLTARGRVAIGGTIRHRDQLDLSDDG